MDDLFVRSQLSISLNRKIQSIRQLEQLHWKHFNILEIWQKMFLTKIYAESIPSPHILSEEYEDMLGYQKRLYGRYIQKILMFQEIQEVLKQMVEQLKQKIHLADLNRQRKQKAQAHEDRALKTMRSCTKAISWKDQMSDGEYHQEMKSQQLWRKRPKKKEPREERSKRREGKPKVLPLPRSQFMGQRQYIIID